MVIKADTTESVVGGSVVELERLFNKALLMQKTFGSLVPGINEAAIPTFHRVLEIGCSSGGWTTAMAQSYYASMDVTGIDPNPRALEYAQTQAADLGLTNVTYYQTKHITGPFSFLPDASFDLISTQFLTEKLRPFDMKDLLQECKRLLRPGGMVRLLDFELGISNGSAHEELIDLFIQAMHASGRSPTPTKRHLGMLCELEPMVRAAGFEQTNILGHMINYSFGAPNYREWVRDFLILSSQLLPFLVRYGLATSEHVNKLYLQQEQELNSPSFGGLLPMVTVLGQRRSC